MRVTFIFAFAAFMILSAATAAEEASVIKGRLLGEDGKPMPMGHVFLREKPNDPIPLQTVKVDKDGGFELTISEHGSWYLFFTGVDHQQFFQGVFIPSALKAEIEVRLKRNPFLPRFGKVKINGPWNDYNTLKTEDMTQEADGTYSYMVNWRESEIKYQLIGTVNNGNSVNGTQADTYAPDSKGDYFSVVNLKDGKGKITFDPKKAVPGDANFEPKLSYTDPNGAFAQITEAIRFNQSQFEVFNIRLNGHLSAGRGEAIDFLESYDWSSALTELNQKIATAKDPEIRKVWFAIMLNYHNQRMVDEKKYDMTKALSLLKDLDPADPTWILASGGLAKVTIGDERLMSYTDQVLAKHPDKPLRSNLLRTLLWYADQLDNEKAMTHYHGILQKNAAEYPELGFLLTRFDPARPVRKGKQIPDFEVMLMDEARTRVSKTSMKGKIYLLDFWATWCGPCVKELPELQKVYDQFHKKGFEILSLSFDPNPELVVNFRTDRHKMPWLHTYVVDGFKSGLAKSFGVDSIPRPILVDEKGIAIALEGELRGANLMRTLEKVFADKGEGPAKSNETKD